MLYDRTGGVVCVRRESIAFVASFAFGPQHRELDGFRLGERARAIGAPSLEAGPYRKATPRRKHADLVLIDAGVCRADVFAHIVHGRPCSEVVIDPRVLDGGEARAVLLNDDWSTVEFVVDQLESVYGFSTEDAAQIASEVDREGRAWVSRGPVDALVPDAQALIDAAREKGFPLRIDIEPE
jgi:ATP-dependent Clp protease adaptor protein ClpS